MVTGVLGLLAFILALSFNMAANRSEQRKQNVLNDANALSIAYLRARLVGLVPFALALTAMMYLIADLDSPQSGMFIVSQQPMLDTLASIRQSK